MKNHSHSESHIAEETRALLAATSEATEGAVVEARNRLQSALEATSATYAKVKARAVEGAKATDKAIRQNPYQALGIAFGLGALVGFLMSRRNRD